MKENLLQELWEQLKEFVFKKTALAIFLLTILFFFIINRFTNFSFNTIFLSDLLNSLIFVVLSFFSLIIGRPLVAYTSALARQWPLQWYWHPQIRPAYKEVTFFWLIYFSIKLVVQWRFINQLGVINFLLGWPSLIVLLVFSYLYGQKRLKDLQGPSVEEFKKQQKPPWKGQQKGF
jgi:hypothetical protein